MGRPKKDIDAVTMRVERDAYELARRASGGKGESLIGYVSRVLRERAKVDIVESAKQAMSEFGEPESTPEPTPKPKRKGGGS